MPQSTITLVKDLINQLNRFTELSSVFEPEFRRSEIELSVSLSYSRLRFSMSKEQADYFQYTLRQETPNADTVECYYHDPNKIEMLQAHFASLATGAVENSSSDASGDVIYSETLAPYLTIAESIARCAYGCAKGDDYRPGYFSEIIVEPQGITLQQVNHMNSRSLDHKDDYSLRDLKFFISFGHPPDEKPLAFQEDQIGMMRIVFSDRSSQNIRMCGDRIREKIAEEKLQFGKMHS